jgi:beta-mannosidase
VAHRFDVTDALREGDNELRVEFDSALRVGNERACAYLGDGTSDRGKQSYFNFGPRAFIRKPQYMFGWDWGPELVSCGLWQKVELVTVPVARIMDFRHRVTFLGKGENERAVVEIEAFVERVPGARDTPLTLRAAFTEVGWEYLWQYEDDVLPEAQVVPVPLGGKPVQGARVSLTIKNPRRWWPNGMDPDGAHAHPPLYRLCLTVGDQTGQTDELVAHIGLRTIELVREPDADKKGEGFKFRVNSVDTFIKGANCDSRRLVPVAAE